MSRSGNLAFASQLAIIASKYPRTREGLAEAVREAQSQFGMNEHQAYIDLEPFFSLSAQLPVVPSQLSLPQFGLPQFGLPQAPLSQYSGLSSSPQFQLPQYQRSTPSPQFQLPQYQRSAPTPTPSPGSTPSPTPPSRSPSASPPSTRFFPMLSESRRSPVYGLSPESDPPVPQNVIAAIARKYRTEEGQNQHSWIDAVQEAVDFGLDYPQAIDQLRPYFQIGQTDGTGQVMNAYDNLRTKGLKGATEYLGNTYGGTTTGYILATKLLTDAFGINRAKASELLQPYFPIVG